MSVPELAPRIEARWYCVSREGLATLCKDEADAHETSGQCDKSWPLGGPHRAVRLVDASEIERLRAENAELRRLLARYRDETPLGHQPHMIAHQADEALKA